MASEVTLDCARCGHPKSEHHYNGASYGICGEYKPRTQTAPPQDDLGPRLAQAFELVGRDHIDTSLILHWGIFRWENASEEQRQSWREAALRARGWLKDGAPQ